MNPFEEKGRDLDRQFCDLTALAPTPYPEGTDPYTKTRVILMNGTEFEAVWFSHQLSRHVADPEVRRVAGYLRRIEQQQQKRLGYLKPIKESILEHTIGYEQLAVDLTAALAKRESDDHVREALNFALLEDFDHLYRFADLLEMEEGVKAEELVGHYTEITPGRPTIAEHRHPYDNLRLPISAGAALTTKLCANIITAAEQQTMNYYMNIAPFYKNDKGRQLYSEIGLIEEQHVSWYGSLINPGCTWLEGLLMHEYTECYLYWSCYSTESDHRLKELWEMHLQDELGHLHAARQLLERLEKKTPEQVLPQLHFPDPLKLTENIDYVRKVLGETVTLTSVDNDRYLPVDDLEEDSRFFRFQQIVCPHAEDVPSHKVIADYIQSKGMDYRFETAENPVAALRDRKKDNVSLARCKSRTGIQV